MKTTDEMSNKIGKCLEFITALSVKCNQLNLACLMVDEIKTKPYHDLTFGGMVMNLFSMLNEGDIKKTLSFGTIYYMLKDMLTYLGIGDKKLEDIKIDDDNLQLTFLIRLQSSNVLCEVEELRAKYNLSYTEKYIDRIRSIGDIDYLKDFFHKVCKPNQLCLYNNIMTIKELLEYTKIVRAYALDPLLYTYRNKVIGHVDINTFNQSMEYMANKSDDDMIKLYKQNCIDLFERMKYYTIICLEIVSIYYLILAHILHEDNSFYRNILDIYKTQLLLYNNNSKCYKYTILEIKSIQS